MRNIPDSTPSHNVSLTFVHGIEHLHDVKQDREGWEDTGPQRFVLRGDGPDEGCELYCLN